MKYTKYRTFFCSENVIFLWQRIFVSVHYLRFMDTPYRILFVCLGNICRSPAGENVMNALLAQNNITHIKVDSAGTANYHTGKGPDKRMATELAKRGFPNNGQARQFSKEDFHKFDLIIPMDHSNTLQILSLAESNEDKQKVTPFTSYCSLFDYDEVPDPYYGGIDGFSEVIEIMEDGCKGILEKITN